MMKKDQEFHDFVVQDVLEGIEGITSRSMFGGWGIYKDRVFFALIAEGVLYCKVDAVTQPTYEEAGSEPFRYQKKDGTATTMSYWMLPEAVMEDRDLLRSWVGDAVAAAQRGKKK